MSAVRAIRLSAVVRVAMSVALLTCAGCGKGVLDRLTPASADGEAKSAQDTLPPPGIGAGNGNVTEVPVPDAHGPEAGTSDLSGENAAVQPSELPLFLRQGFPGDTLTFAGALDVLEPGAHPACGERTAPASLKPIGALVKLPAAPFAGASHHRYYVCLGGFSGHPRANLPFRALDFNLAFESEATRDHYAGFFTARYKGSGAVDYGVVTLAVSTGADARWVSNCRSHSGWLNGSESGLVSELVAGKSLCDSRRVVVKDPTDLTRLGIKDPTTPGADGSGWGDAPLTLRKLD